MKTLTTEQIETLKTMDWQDDRKEAFNTALLYFSNTNDSYFQDITGVCVSCLRELLGNNNTMESFYWEIAYRKHEENLFDLHYAIWCKNDVVKDGVIQEFNTDILGLFTEEKNDNPIERLKKALVDCANDPSIDTAEIQATIEDLDYIWDAIKSSIIDNLDVDGLTESLKEDVAKDWIEENSGYAYDKAVDNMATYEIRDKIIDYLSDNL